MDEEGPKYKVACFSDTLKTETSNFVLNPSLHWKPVECSELDLQRTSRAA